MNFTREPIIETIITPKEGHKLLVRNTKGSSAEEYIVDALEVVSFGQSFFFRSLERPKSFLVPVSDYEVSETKETRVVLKNATFERNIKIGGGAKPKEKAVVETDEQEPAAVEQRLDKKRERRRHRRRRTTDEIKETEETKTTEKPVAEGGGADDEIKPSSSIIKRLIPPPPGLISESISKAKAQNAPEAEGNVLPEPVEEKEKPKPQPKKKEEVEPPKETEGGEAQRVAVEAPEVVTSTSFSTLTENAPFGKIW